MVDGRGAGMDGGVPKAVPVVGGPGVGEAGGTGFGTVAGGVPGVGVWFSRQAGWGAFGWRACSSGACADAQRNAPEGCCEEGGGADE